MQVNEFHSVLHMQLQQVPPFSEGGSAKSSKAGSSEHGEEENLDDSVSEIILNTDGKIQTLTFSFLWSVIKFHSLACRIKN